MDTDTWFYLAKAAETHDLTYSIMQTWSLPCKRCRTKTCSLLDLAQRCIPWHLISTLHKMQTLRPDLNLAKDAYSETWSVPCKIMHTRRPDLFRTLQKMKTGRPNLYFAKDAVGDLISTVPCKRWRQGDLISTLQRCRHVGLMWIKYADTQTWCEKM